MASWDSYTEKTTPADNDTLMIKDTAGGANKRTPFSGVWNWIVKKLASAVISQLETTNKSIIPAINELNSNKIIKLSNVKYIDITNDQYFSLLIVTNINSAVCVLANSYSDVKILKIYDHGVTNYEVQALEPQNKVTITLPTPNNKGFAIFSGVYSNVKLRRSM